MSNDADNDHDDDAVDDDNDHDDDDAVDVDDDDDTIMPMFGYNQPPTCFHSFPQI